MKRVIPVLFLMTMFVLRPQFAAEALPTHALDRDALRHSFEAGGAWTISADQSQSSRVLTEPSGSVWDCRNVAKVMVQAERSNSAAGSARLRWIANSRLGGTYLGPAIALPLSGPVTATLNFSGDGGELTPVGHQRPWDSLAAAEVLSIGLRAEYTPNLKKENSASALEVALSNADVVMTSATETKPAVLDLNLQADSDGQRLVYILSFRINPMPADPYSATGDGDVRIRFPDGTQSLAFLDQDVIEINDGASARLSPIGLPIWRAYISKWPSSGSFEIVSGKNKWALPCSALTAEHISTAAKQTDDSTPSIRASSFEARSAPKALARLRWETPLEATAPAMNASWTGTRAYWTLNRAGSWIPASATDLKDVVSQDESAKSLPKKVWRPIPFWNETWGGYADARRPDIALALQMDERLKTAARANDHRALVLFDGASLDRQGVFNWASHPLQKSLAGPGEIFRTEAGFDFCARWMRYVMARYSHSPAVTSLLISTDLNAPGASEFFARLAPLLKDWRAGAAGDQPLVSLHPLTQPAQIVKSIGTFDADNRAEDANWHVDQRFARAFGHAVDHVGLDGSRCYELSAIEPSTVTVALENTYNLEYSDWRKPADDNFFACNALMFEVYAPPDAPSDLRVGVHLRDRNGNWFQTLLPGMIRRGDWTTFALDLTAANVHGLTAINHRCAWTDYSRQRIREIGLHVYSTHPRFTLANGRIQNLSARFDNIRGVIFPQTAPDAKTEIALFDPLQPSSAAGVSKTFGHGALVEYHLKINKAFANPYDPRDCDLTAVIKTPSGKTVRVPAFFDQLCERHEATAGGDEIVEPVGGEFFTVRYRAQENGMHALAFELRENGRYDVARAWINDNRFSPEGEGQAGVSRHWPFTIYSNGLNEDGKRPIDTVNFVPGTLTATLDLGPSAFDVAETFIPVHGFVRVAKDKRHFEFDDGTFFYPIGPCLRSPGDSRMAYRSPEFAPEVIDKLSKRGTYQYDVFFDAFHKAGITWARVWMCSWWGSLEWRRDWPGYQGLGRYNLLNAWRMDYVVDLAEKNDIHIDLATTNHGQFTLDIDSEWKNNPYNAKLGGPLKAPCEIFTRGEAKIYHQNKLRYIAARYGHSPTIMTFSLFSEIEFTEEYERSLNIQNQTFQTDFPAPNIERWHAEMAGFFKSIDPNRHLVATHFSHPTRGEGTLAVPEIDIATSNAYSAFEELGYASRNVFDASAALHDFWAGSEDGTVKGFHIFDKPALVEEQGRHWMGVERGRDHNNKAQLEADLHAGLWGGMVVPLGGATGYWWWLEVHFDNRYFEYRALSEFMKGEDLRPMPGETPFKLVFSSVGKTVLLGRAMKSDRRLYGWIYHPETPLGDNVPPVVPGASMNIRGLRAGKYCVEFWNTYKGERMSTSEIEFTKDKLSNEIKLPDVDRDLALKIKPLE